MRKDQTKVVTLIVDDEPLIRRFVRSLLKDFSPLFQIHEAKDGTGAARVLLKAKPDLVILDICIPQIGGIELCRLIKDQCDFQKTRILAMTGHPTPEIKDELTKNGVTDFLAKPFDKKTFFGVLQELLPWLAS